MFQLKVHGIVLSLPVMVTCYSRIVFQTLEYKFVFKNSGFLSKIIFFSFEDNIDIYGI